MTNSNKLILTLNLQKLFKPAAALLLATLLLTFTVGLLAQEQVLAQPDNPLRFNPAATQNITLTTTAVGDSLPRIQCLQSYSATIYTENLTAPDGLAFDSSDRLYVAQEINGTVSQIGPNGTITNVITGLSSPEGIAFDGDDNLYVVEDVTNGRVIKWDGAGTSTVASGLEAPEGIVWVDDGSPDGILYVTESNLANAFSVSSTVASDYRTRVAAVSLAGTVTQILTTTPDNFPAVAFPPPATIEPVFWSYTGEIDMGPGGLLYFSNELAGQTISGAYDVAIPFPPFLISIPYTFTTSGSLFTIDPTAVTTPTVFVGDGLTAPEGLGFSPNGGFPLYVAEEGALGQPDGRLSRVDKDGSFTPFCTGFEDIEDVIVDQNGWLYVSEDKNGAPGSGLVILIKPNLTPSVWLPVILRQA